MGSFCGKVINTLDGVCVVPYENFCSRMDAVTYMCLPPQEDSMVAGTHFTLTSSVDAQNVDGEAKVE